MNGEQQFNADPLAPKTGSASPPRTDPLVGTTLDGRFQIEEVLGSGGAGVVYKAKQLRVNRYVAIKTIHVHVENSEVIRERFQREINSLCALSHPNIVTVYDCIFGWDDQPYIVMDYLKGLSLDALLRRNGPLDLDTFARIALQVLSALEHAHKKGVVHRDLKPGNIVLMDDETDIVKVVDFGLAKLGHDRSLTKSGELWGSPPYMSPEQAQGEPADERSDIYSLGAVLYEMLTGKDPFFDVVTVYELIQAHVFKDPPAFEHSNPDVSVPASVQTVIFKSLSKNPLDRFQTVGDFQSALVEALSAQLEGESKDYLLRFSTRSSSRDPDLEVTKKGAALEANGSSGARHPEVQNNTRTPTAKLNAGAMNSRFQSFGFNSQNENRWIPWTIAACSLLLALSLGVLVLELLSRDHSQAVTSENPPIDTKTLNSDAPVQKADASIKPTLNATVPLPPKTAPQVMPTQDVSAVAPPAVVHGETALPSRSNEASKAHARSSIARPHSVAHSSHAARPARSAPAPKHEIKHSSPKRDPWAELKGERD